MLFTLLNWLWIGLSCFLWGYAGVCVLNKLTNSSIRSIDMIFVYGISLLAVYAQYFSLFYKVGVLANIILLCCNIFIMCILRNDIRILLIETKNIFFGDKKIFLGIVLLILVGVMLVITSAPINHYDTLLYHAQSIKWVEEYGVVKGLGNLHNRFAYNSSIFALQALFSMPYLFGQSMHSVNGFIAFFFLAYSISSMKWIREKKIFISDFLRLAMIVSLNFIYIYRYISSAGSDLFAIVLFFYILIKTVTLLEEREQSASEFAYLSILGVFAVSVKLSVAMIVLIVCIPVYRLIITQKWKEIGIYLLAGFLIILPFLARNVIISGYLVYPYPAIDIFDVDWKMAAYTLLYDSNEIKIYGRGMRDVIADFDCSFGEWFPIWFNGLSVSIKSLFFLNVILMPMAILWGIYETIHKKWESFCIVVVIIANLLLWFWGAPLARYGLPFMLLLPVYMLGNMILKIKKTYQVNKLIICTFTLCSVFCNFPLVKYAYEQLKNDDVDWKQAANYIEYECTVYDLEGELIYVPVSGDQTGYDTFPSAPYVKMLNLIELRGERIEDGFRIQEEYADAYIPNNGNISEINIFDK